MKTYGILKKMSMKKNGQFVPIPKQSDRNQMYFDFYKSNDLSMEKKKKLLKSEGAGHNVDICE